MNRFLFNILILLTSSSLGANLNDYAQSKGWDEMQLLKHGLFVGQPTGHGYTPPLIFGHNQKACLEPHADWRSPEVVYLRIQHGNSPTPGSKLSYELIGSPWGSPTAEDYPLPTTRYVYQARNQVIDAVYQKLNEILLSLTTEDILEYRNQNAGDLGKSVFKYQTTKMEYASVCEYNPENLVLFSETLEPSLINKGCHGTRGYAIPFKKEFDKQISFVQENLENGNFKKQVLQYLAYLTTQKPPLLEWTLSNHGQGFLYNQTANPDHILVRISNIRIQDNTAGCQLQSTPGQYHVQLRNEKHGKSQPPFNAIRLNIPTNRFLTNHLKPLLDSYHMVQYFLAPETARSLVEQVRQYEI